MKHATTNKFIANNNTSEYNFTIDATTAASPIIAKKQGLDVYINGTKKVTFPNSTYTTPGTIFIFALNENYAVRPGNRGVDIPLYYMKIGDLDLIPVRKGNIGYLYDKVSGKLFANQGTGTFTLGPDKYDSEVQYIESTGT